MDIVGLYVLSYLLGSIPTAYLIGRMVKHVDIRSYGSGNVGGSNILHHFGKRWSVPLEIWEILVKGALPVWIGLYVVGLERSSALLVVTPLLAVVGHNWSVFLKFQGGRGIAVVVGSLLALSPWLLAAFAVVFSAGWLITRSSGVWVLIAITLLPAWAVLVRDPIVISYYCVGLVALVVIKRLFSNWTPFPEDLPKGRVLLNRLFLDRDVEDRSVWVHRVPQGTE